jgi:hypothetical protein
MVSYDNIANINTVHSQYTIQYSTIQYSTLNHFISSHHHHPYHTITSLHLYAFAFTMYWGCQWHSTCSAFVCENSKHCMQYKKPYNTIHTCDTVRDRLSICIYVWFRVDEMGWDGMESRVEWIYKEGGSEIEGIVWHRTDTTVQLSGVELSFVCIHLSCTVLYCIVYGDWMWRIESMGNECQGRDLSIYYRGFSQRLFPTVSKTH